MRGITWLMVPGVGGLMVLACATKQVEADAPPSSSPSGESAAEPFSPSGEMEVGMSFDGAEAPPDEEAEEGSTEPPPTPTYSPANKLSPEEKAAANARDP